MHWLEKSSHPKAKDKEFISRQNIESGKQVSVCNLLMNYYAKRVMLKNDLEAFAATFWSQLPFREVHSCDAHYGFFHR